jgi:hypothetical protein
MIFHGQNKNGRIKRPTTNAAGGVMWFKTGIILGYSWDSYGIVIGYGLTCKGVIKSWMQNHPTLGHQQIGVLIGRDMGKTVGSSPMGWNPLILRQPQLELYDVV